MNYTDRVCAEAVETFGHEQLIKAAEELSELSAAILRYYLYRDDKAFESVLEEYADVTIMLNQIDQMLGLDCRVDSMIDLKLSRLEVRIQKAQGSSDFGGNE